MRPLVYLLCVVLVLPAVQFALFFEAVAGVVALGTLGHAVAVVGRGLWRLLEIIDALGGPWVLIAAAVAIVAALIGFLALAWSPRRRWIGAALTAIVAVAATVSIVARAGPPRSVGEALFHVPAMTAVGLALWLLATDVRDRPARSPLSTSA